MGAERRWSTGNPGSDSRKKGIAAPSAGEVAGCRQATVSSMTRPRRGNNSNEVLKTPYHKHCHSRCRTHQQSHYVHKRTRVTYAILGVLRVSLSHLQNPCAAAQPEQALPWQKQVLHVE